MSAKQKYILKYLDSKGFWIKQILDYMMDKALTAQSINPVTWAMEESDTVKLAWFKELLWASELRWNNWAINVRLNLAKIIYSKDGDIK